MKAVKLKPLNLPTMTGGSLLSLATRTGTGYSDPLEVVPYEVGSLQLNATACSTSTSTATLDVTLEFSVDGAGWTALFKEGMTAPADALNAVGFAQVKGDAAFPVNKVLKLTGAMGRFIRVKWVISGSDTFTFKTDCLMKSLAT